MTNKQTTRHLFTVLLMLLLGTFCPAALVRAQKPAAAKASSPASGPKEGIKVHGHWTIEVRNPDGTLVERREFKNALTGFGAASMGQFLQRTHKPGEWGIELSGGAFEGPCASLISRGPCYIYETTSQRASSNVGGASPVVFKTLTITSEGGPNTNRTVLAGTATAGANGLINAVGTLLDICPVDTQGVCTPNGGFDGEFTRTTLPTPISVVVGQIIQVKVVISFS